MNYEHSKTSLNDICLNITDGKHGDCENQNNSGFYFVSVKDIQEGEINYKNARQITEYDFEDTNKRTKFALGDILITNSGTIGKMVFIDKSNFIKNTTFQKSVAIIKPNPKKIIPKFLYYFLLFKKKYFIQLASGSVQKNLLLKDIRNFKVDSFSFEFQKRIIKILDSIESKLKINKLLNQNIYIKN